MEAHNSIHTHINSFLTNGILSKKEAEEFVKVESSYDKKHLPDVSLNCVIKVDGIAQSLYKNAANSSFGVVTEESLLKEGCFIETLNRLNDSIVKYKQSLPKVGEAFLNQAALKNVVSKDEKFQMALSQKTHNTALFVLLLEATKDEIESTTAFRETRREKVLPGKLIRVLIPEKHKENLKNLKNEKILFVESKKAKFSISYKDNLENIVSCETFEEITVPDYETLLTEIYNEDFLNKAVMYTHITRLP